MKGLHATVALLALCPGKGRPLPAGVAMTPQHMDVLGQVTEQLKISNIKLKTGNTKCEMMLNFKLHKMKSNYRK